MASDRQGELALMVAYLRQRPALIKRCLALGGDADVVLAVTARAMAEAQYPTLRRDMAFRRWCTERADNAETWDISA